MTRPSSATELTSDTDALRALALLDRLEAVLHDLFPQGASGGKFYVGDVDGNPGKSLMVELDGPRRGLWKRLLHRRGRRHHRSVGALAGPIRPQRLPHAGEIRQWLVGLLPRSVRRCGDVRSVPMDDLGAYTGKWDYLTADGELIARSPV